MIDDMALLKQAMEQMDAEDPVVAQAAKDRAAQTLSNARLSFSKMAELIEQRRLLLRPRIVAGIKRMDQPGMLGDTAFRDTGSALRRDGQSFRQIAEAIELAARPSLRYEDPAQNSAPPHQMASEPGEPAWMRALVLVASMVFFPLRHPARFLAIALVAILLFYALGGFVSLGQQVWGHFDGVAAVRRSADQAMSSVSSFVDAQILRRSKEATAPPTAAAPIPSPPAAPPSPSPSATPSAAPATAPAPPATASAPPANASAPPAPLSAAPAPPSASPAGPAAPTPRRDARGDPPSRSAADPGAAREDRYSGSRGSAPFEDDRPRAFEDVIPGGIRRHSRMAGPCIGGVGGCYWGGGQY
jgi:hypothetical protein